MENRLESRLSFFTASILFLTVFTGAQQLPPFDPAPAIKDGQGMFKLPLIAQSEMLDLAIEVVLGVKILVSEALSIPPENLYYVDAGVVDEKSSLYSLRYDVVTPFSEVEALKLTAEEFVSSGGLADGFANLGVSGMQFVLGASAAGLTSTTTASSKPNKPQPVPLTPDTTPSPPVSPTPKPSPPPRQPDTEDSIAALIDVEPALLPEEEISRFMHLYIRSPVLFFHPDLKLAITWFAGDRTGTLTEPASWYMIDVTLLNTTLGQYIASFVHISAMNTTEESVSFVEGLVDTGDLNEFLAENDARNVTVSLLPIVNNVRSEPNLTVPEGFSTAVLLLRVSGPITGVTAAVSDRIKESGAAVTNTKAEDWRVKGIVSEVDGALNGPWWVDYEVVILDTNQALVQTVANMTMFVRTKVLEREFWDMGLTDIRILPRKRLTKFKSSSGGGAIQSSAATVAASIGGMMIVIVVGGFIMCLLPRDEGVEVQNRRRRFRRQSRTERISRNRQH